MDSHTLVKNINFQGADLGREEGQRVLRHVQELEPPQRADLFRQAGGIRAQNSDSNNKTTSTRSKI